MPGKEADVVGRHPSRQLKNWLNGTPYANKIQEAYADQPETRLNFADAPDVVYTDVRVLCDEILGKSTGDAKGLIQRLRYVVIDHPNRLAREDLIRLRIAIARLRMTAELYGRDVTFIVMLPRLNNFQELGKWLLNNDDVPFQLFDAWYSPTMVMGWLPPHELVDIRAEEPRFARAKFSDELIAVLTELGIEAHKMRRGNQDPLRIGVVDPQPLLGPEFRAQLGELVLDSIKREVVDHTEPLEFIEDWTFFGTLDLSIDRERAFDVIVVVGIGAHPEYLVSSLRAALAEDGALLLVADASPVDYESLRQMKVPGWDPADAVREVRYPKVVLPKHSEAVIAHELASLFEDFRTRPVPRSRLKGIFPSEATDELLETWIMEGILQEMQAFEAPRKDTAPETAPYLRQRGSTAKLTSERYDVPWGCCSRRVLGIYDETSKSDSNRVGASLITYVDRDRLFIDFHQKAMLRYPPNTVEVVGLDLRQLDSKELEKRKQSWVSEGQVHVRQVDYDDGIKIDRRAARYRVRLVSERPFQSRIFDPTLREHDELVQELEGHSLREALYCESDPASRFKHQTGILASAVRPPVPSVGNRPLLRLVGGTWIAVVEEGLRDIIQTGERLVEDAELVQVQTVTAKVRTSLKRTFETVGTTLAFEITDKCLSNIDDEDCHVDRDLVVSRAAHYALARSLSLGLGQVFMGFDREYRVSVIGRPPMNSAWRARLAPIPGTPGRYARYDPATAEPLAKERVKIRGGGPAEIEDICALFDLMHERFQYEKDEVQYGEKEYIASVAETLRSGKGDCEDHAILFASLCMAVGWHARTVLLKDHALCQVYLGKTEDVNDEVVDDLVGRIRGWHADRSERWGISELTGGVGRPYFQGQVCEGWKKVGDQYEPQSASASTHPIQWKGIWIEETEEGESWLTCDDCMGGTYPGDVSGLEREGYLSKSSGWKEEVQYQYPHHMLTDWRILIYRLRDNELHPSDQVATVFEGDLGAEILPAALEALEGCDCEDGCSACCGGLGTIDMIGWKEGNFDPEWFTEADVVSRKGAYRLACALTGREPNWDLFGAKKGTGVDDGTETSGPVVQPPPSELRALVTEIVGTRNGDLKDGLWTKLFGPRMKLDPNWLATYRWAVEADEVDAPAWYSPGDNETVYRPHSEKLSLQATIVHEYTHNWQFKGPFDRDRHLFGEEALQYFSEGGEGTGYRESSGLVIEGHARWADHAFRFHRGMGSVYKSTDPDRWNEYKVGYYLMEGIVSAFGLSGLFAWLGPNPEAVDPPPRSRDKRLAWRKEKGGNVFTLTEALRAFGLEDEARTGQFNGIDVLISGPGSLGEETPTGGGESTPVPPPGPGKNGGAEEDQLEGGGETDGPEEAQLEGGGETDGPEEAQLEGGGETNSGSDTQDGAENETSPSGVGTEEEIGEGTEEEIPQSEPSETEVPESETPAV
jgi:hypothetical protein